MDENAVFASPFGTGAGLVARECVFYRPPLPIKHVLRLHVEVLGNVTDLLDMFTLMRWRAACRLTYAQAAASLRRTLVRLLSRFLPRPGAMLSVLTRYRGVIGGVTAVAFLLRDFTIECNALQVFMASRMYSPFVEALRRCPENSSAIVKVHVGRITRTFAVQREVNAFASIQLGNGRHILVYRSSTITPLSGVVRSTSTALMNFVTEHSFGCSFPRLTFNRRSMLCDYRLEHLTDMDHMAMDALLRGQFHFAVSPGAWPDFRGPSEDSDTEDLPANTMPCYRQQFACPQQARFFGDQGSMVALFDPLGPEIARIRVLGVPPFGPMIVWRLLSSFMCASECEKNDVILHRWMLSTPILTLPVPFPLDSRMVLEPVISVRGNGARVRAKSV